MSVALSKVFYKTVTRSLVLQLSELQPQDTRLPHTFQASEEMLAPAVAPSREAGSGPGEQCWAPGKPPKREEPQSEARRDNS